MGRNRSIIDAIKAEVESDPAARGYKNADGSWKSPAEIFALGCEPSVTVPAGPVPTWQVLGLIDASENEAALADPYNAKIFEALSNQEYLPLGSPELDAIVERLYGPDSSTRQAYRGIATKSISRFTLLDIPTDRVYHVRRACEEVSK